MADTDAPAAQTPPAPSSAPSGPASAPATDAAPERNLGGDEPADDWRPPQQREDGQPVDADGLPTNYRLRSLELAQRGETSDPAGLVSDELVADAAGRLAAYREAFPAIDSKTTTAELERMAKAESVDISGAETNAQRAQLIQAARPPLV